ncbi:exported hypothetical protein [Hyella patelloides LEGE 07179]|uniref:PEP-CTERM sorting domain-containing protein n=1 Tax=Hyella patelloides LEGE 07179 TaxID=945734 RepID=A0A563W3W3_9CYAN|nr:hypothetical protein [Hyella patelloides]VEP18340.1 exported hypothetical protein [Hyella patelloides LEGE 07179]
MSEIMKIFKIKAIGFSTLFLGLAQTSANAFTLDAFSDANVNTGTFYFNGSPITTQNGVFQAVSNLPNNATGLYYSDTDSDTGLSTSSVVGGSRHMTINTVDNSGEAILQTASSTLPDAIGLASDGTPSIATVVWNGSNTIDFNNLNSDANLNVNLTQEGDDSIVVDIILSDLGGKLTLELYDGTNFHPYEQDIPQVDPGNGFPEQTLYYDFSTYINNGVDVTSIDYIKMTIDSNNQSSYDARFDFIEAAIQPQGVPFDFSPSLGLILGGSLFSFLRLRKKFQQN